MKKENTEMAFGVPVWQLYSCEICGSLLVPRTEALHAAYHQGESRPEPEPKFANKVCPTCSEEIIIPILPDGSMDLENYDTHMDTH